MEARDRMRGHHPHGEGGWREHHGGERHGGRGEEVRHGGPGGRRWGGRGRPDEGPPFRGPEEGPPFRGPRPPFGGFRGHFGRGPHVGRGDVRAATLALLAEQPLNGYQIIQQISERSGGVWRPSSGSVYPGLQLLEDEGLVRAEEADGRRVFHLTDAGRAYAAEHREQLSAVWQAVAGTVDDTARELGELFQQVGAAVRQVAQAGSAAEIAEARQLLIATRRQLYRILAGGEPAGGTEER